MVTIYKIISKLPGIYLWFNIVCKYKLFSVEEVIDIIKNRKENIEVIITGRYAPDEIIEIADLVTEMKEVKHYYTKNVEARKGIEF